MRSTRWWRKSTGNGASAHWKPIVYEKRHFNQVEMIALHGLAEFCVVSSLHDGMNLVAKEFVSSRVRRGWGAHPQPVQRCRPRADRRGADQSLLRRGTLGRDAPGARDAPRGAQPTDVPDARGGRREQRLPMGGEDRLGADPDRHRGCLLAGPVHTGRRSHPGGRSRWEFPSALLEVLDEVGAIAETSSHLLLFLDFDGTLAPIAESPELVGCPRAARDPGRALAAGGLHRRHRQRTGPRRRAGAGRDRRPDLRGQSWPGDLRPRAPFR